MGDGGGLVATSDPKDVINDCLSMVQSADETKRRVRQLHPVALCEVQEIIVAALSIFILRPSDITLREHAQLLYVLAGDQSMRAHNGVMYMHENGAWQPFSGLISDTTLAHFRIRMLRVEGVFRLMNPLTTRDEVGLRTAIMNSYTASQSLQHWLHNIESAVLTGARQAREPQADPGHIAVPEPAATTWTTRVADAFMRTSASLQRELLGKRIISYFIEWC